MNLLNIPLPELTATTLKTLLDSEPGTNKESLTLDFKRDTQLGDEKQKQKLLKWISSFANTAGGDLVIGVSQHGTDYDITGIPNGMDTDGFQQQISSIISLSLEPRLSRPVEFKEIMLGEQKILIVRTYPSFNKPHAVKVNDGYKFFVRLPNGQSMPMDIHQIRSAVIGSESLVQQIKAFKADRIGSLLSKNAPFELPDEGKMVIHLIPLDAFSQNLYIDPQHVDPQQAGQIYAGLLAPLRASGYSWQYNFEGFAAHNTTRLEETEITQSYTQFFRNGALEFVYTCAHMYQARWQIPSQAYEELVAIAVNRSLTLYNSLDLPAPYFVSITFINVKGCYLGVDRNRFFFDEPRPLSREVVYLPDVRIDTQEVNVFDTLKPAFDTFWQCFGFERSYNYDEQGKWIKKA